jgi:hypothetical protein
MLRTAFPTCRAPRLLRAAPSGRSRSGHARAAIPARFASNAPFRSGRLPPREKANACYLLRSAYTNSYLAVSLRWKPNATLMHKANPQAEAPLNDYGRRLRWRWFLVTICALTLLIAFLRTRRHDEPAPSPVATDQIAPSNPTDPSKAEPTRRQPRPASPPPMLTPTAGEDRKSVV